MILNGSVTSLTTATRMRTGKTPEMPFSAECRRPEAVIPLTRRIKLTDNEKGQAYAPVPLSCSESNYLKCMVNSSPACLKSLLSLPLCSGNLTAYGVR